MVTNKDKYREFCKNEKTILIFNQPWWLDLLCGDDWDVCLVERDSHVIACMPFYIKKRYALKLLSQPILTQHLGPWFKPSTAKYCKSLAQKKKLMQSLISQLPDYDFFSQNWHYSQTNWLPFYWQGFKQTTRYTYVLENLGCLEKVWQEFQENIRGDIRKAEGKFGLTVVTDLDIDIFLELNKKTFSRQGISSPYPFDQVRKVIIKAVEREQCKWFVAQDSEGRNHAGVLIIWDESSAYYLMGGGDPTLRNSGATSLCMWEAIKFASTVTNKFDFEGSMIEPVERFFRGFGAIQKPYFNISKTNSQLIKVALCLRDLIRT